MTDANNLQLFTVRDAAKLLDMSEHTIRRLQIDLTTKTARGPNRTAHHAHQERNLTPDQKEHLRKTTRMFR